MSEKVKIQLPVQEYLKKLKIKWYTKPNNQYQQKYRSSVNKKFKGLPDDIIWMRNGKTLFFEYKDGTTLSDKQKEYAEYLLENGHIFHVIESFDQAITIINYWNKPERVKIK